MAALRNSFAPTFDPEDIFSHEMSILTVERGRLAKQLRFVI